MEATATRRDGGGPRPSSPRWIPAYYDRDEKIGSAGSYTDSWSSRSGTIVSSAYTSGASRPSLSTDFELIKIHGYDEHLSGLVGCTQIHLNPHGLERVEEEFSSCHTPIHSITRGSRPNPNEASWGEKIKEQEKMKRVIELVNGGATSALNLKRWFTELRVDWVLDIAESARECQRTGRSCGGFAFYAPCWIHALAEVVETIRFTSTLPLPDPCSHTGDDAEQVAVPNPNQFFLQRVTSKIVQIVRSKLFLTNSDVVTDDRVSIPDQIVSSSEKSITVDQIQFARFTQVAMFKLLAFVDVLLLVAVDSGQQYRFSGNPPETYSYHKLLKLLLDVHGALSKALEVIEVLSVSSPPGEVQRIQGEIFRLLSTKEDMALDPIWLTLNHTTTHVLDWLQYVSLQRESSDIHKVTLSVISYISFLVDNKSSLDLTISEAQNRGKAFVYESRIDIQPLNCMIIEMVSRLQEKLANISESYSDQCLRFLFLMNNSNLIIKQQLHYEPDSSLQVHVAALLSKFEMYMESYVQLSWAPVLSCLLNPTPLCYGRSSPLTKFESAFQKTYTIQKLWKVPDPELRKWLRKAITNKIIYGYTKYIEDNNVTTPKFTSQVLEELLQELFEG